MVAVGASLVGARIGMTEYLQGTHKRSHPECCDCWARLYCSGGCAANAYHATGKVTGIYEKGCTLFKKRMECAIMVAVARALGE